MAEELEHPVQQIQHEEDAIEEIMETEASVGPDSEGNGEDSSSQSRHSSQMSRSQDDEVHRAESNEIQSSPPAFRCWHESNQDPQTLRNFVCKPAQQSTLGPQSFRPNDADYEAWAAPSNPRCPASFGDHGTTATAGAFGQLIQISNYLGAGNSAMFSAGHSFIPEPYFVTQRARKLHSLASQPFKEAQNELHPKAFGLKLNLKLLGDAPPMLKWFQNKWPCYHYSRGCFKHKESVELTIQFVVQDGIVYQRCILENRGETNVDLKFGFCKGMSIRDLDHVTDHHKYNKTTPDDQNGGPGPGGFGWVHVNRFREGPSTRTNSQHSSHEKNSNGSHDDCNNKSQPGHGVGLIISMAVGREMIRFEPGKSPHIFKQTLEAKSSTTESSSQKLEIVTAYKLVLLENPLSDWKTFIIPFREMNPSRFPREAPHGSVAPLFRTMITRISAEDHPSDNYENHRSGILKDKDNMGEAGMVHVSPDRVPIVGNQPNIDPSSAADHEPTVGKTSPTMEHIEFAVRRNLEHILCVCAIPVAVRIPEEDAEGVIWEKLCRVEPIALSCGDLSGHRVCTRSSFFAFQFLAEAAKRLSRLPQPEKGDTHVKNVLSRIRKVCLGHLKWLYASEKNNKNGTFRSLYWVSGKAVPKQESSQTWVPRGHVRNTAFEILKAIEFANAFDEDKYGYSSLVGEMISGWGLDWVRRLERTDKRGSTTWHHKREEGLKNFRLDDHVWIWRALKAMEHERHGAWAFLHDKAQHEGGNTEGLKPSTAEQIPSRSRKFSSRTFQREVLRKFTTNNEVLRKRMVALTRSLRETRFLLHARDTALFYGQDMGFFPEDTPFQELWQNTIDAQRFHENNEEAQWDNALRYALSIMLGVNGNQINNEEPERMMRIATEVLLGSSSVNGLFPGKLDIVTKEPLEYVFYMEEDAESYYDAGFEIPYILLIHAKAIGTIICHGAEAASGDAKSSHHPTGESLNPTERMPAHHTSRTQDRELRRLLVKLSDVLSARPYLPNSTSASDCTGPTELAVDARLALKKAIPLGKIIDLHSIVEIEDEWLFNYPEFFGSKGDESISIDKPLAFLNKLEGTWFKKINVAGLKQKYSPNNDRGGSAKVQKAASSSSIAAERSRRKPEHSGLLVKDMPRGKHLQGKVAKNNVKEKRGSLEDIWKHISMPRTAVKAKKRMIIWSRRNTELEREAAVLCYAASKGDERGNMLDFFERHFRHENFILDHCNLAYNTWDTELHLSFFILEDGSGPLSGGTARHGGGFPVVQGKHISRGSMGMRFHGDAFDRYWTLHIFINLKLKEHTVAEDVFDSFLPTNESQLFQRKVCEPHAFARMLSQLELNTQEIFEKVQSEMGIKSGAFSWSIPNMDTYSSWIKLWEGFAPLLQALADDLSSAQDLIGQWEMREVDRSQERPRWTHDDEKKYRANITSGQRVLRWRKKRLQDLLDKVESLREACAARLENAREELSFRSNQNIASFTYVTIVFLPLGFAASVFSMSGSPAASWVASMAVIAVVTLAITVIALANAKLLMTLAKKLSEDSLSFTGRVLQSSAIGQEQQRRRDERAQASAVPSEPSDGKQKGGNPLKGHATRHALFWMAYLLIELPARRVALACRALPASLVHIPSLLRPDITPQSSAGSTGELSGTPSRDSTGESHGTSSFDSTSGSSSPLAAAAGKRTIWIVWGMLVLPLLLISWTIQLLFHNILDILAFLGRLTRKTFRALVTLSDAYGAATNSDMVTKLIYLPSSLRPVRKFMSGDEEREATSTSGSASVLRQERV